MHDVILSASILAADFAHLSDDCARAFSAGIDAIHFDVMDHHFVPNLSFGAPICSSLRQSGIQQMIDVHLMVEQPENYVDAFAKAGASMLTFHPGTTVDVAALVTRIEQAGMQAGLAFNPDEPVDIDDALLQRLAMVLIMSVYPGFGGQAFIPESFEKITALRQRIEALQARAYIGVDGGVKAANAQAIINAGADFLVIGSGLFHADDYTAVVKQMRSC